MMASDQAIWDPLPSTNLLQTVMNPESGSCISQTVDSGIIQFVATQTSDIPPE